MKQYTEKKDEGTEMVQRLTVSSADVPAGAETSNAYCSSKYQPGSTTS